MTSHTVSVGSAQVNYTIDELHRAPSSVLTIKPTDISFYCTTHCCCRRHVDTDRAFATASPALMEELCFYCGVASQLGWFPPWEHRRFDNLKRFCSCQWQFLNVSPLPPGSNSHERLLILYCWIFNRPINLACDKGSLATLGKNISACNLHHISPVNETGE